MHPDRFFPSLFSRMLLLLAVCCCACLEACGSAGSPFSASSQQATFTPTTSLQDLSTLVSTRPGTPTHTSTRQGTLAVTVLASPACPGPQAIDQPCPPRPVAKTQVQIEQTTGSIVTTATTDQTGRFSTTLAPGTYLLSVRRAAPSTLGRQQSTSVTITAGQTTTVHIIVDSGLR